MEKDAWGNRGISAALKNVRGGGGGSFLCSGWSAWQENWDPEKDLPKVVPPCPGMKTQKVDLGVAEAVKERGKLGKSWEILLYQFSSWRRSGNQ